MGLFGSDDAGLDYEPHGEYVTAERVGKIEAVLEEDERVLYLTRGSTVDVEGSGSGSSLFGDDRSRKSGTRGYVRAAYTDDRVVIKIPQVLGSDERSVPYHNIVSADLDTGLVNKRVSLHTAGPTYHIEVHEPGKDECREIIAFVREQAEAAQGSDDTSARTKTETPAERLREIESLRDEGLLSDEEYEEKREQLVEEL